MKLKSHLYAFLAIVSWSSLEISGKLLGPDISPFTITAWRFLIGGAILLPFALHQMRLKKLKLDRSSLLALGALGALNVVVSMLLLQLAIHFGKASLTAMIVSMNPIFVSVFAMLILSEKLSRTHLDSFLIGVFGLVLITLFEAELFTGRYLNLPLGILFAVLAGLTFALYTVLAKSLVLKYGNFITNSASFIIGAVLLTLLNFSIGKSLYIPLSGRNLLLMANLGLIISGVAYVLYFEAMKELSAATASIYFFLKPALAAILAWVFLAEALNNWQIMGMMLITGALSRNIWPGKKHR